MSPSKVRRICDNSLPRERLKAVLKKITHRGFMVEDKKNKKILLCNKSHFLLRSRHFCMRVVANHHAPHLNLLEPMNIQEWEKKER
jgi:hypothetical protein